MFLKPAWLVGAAVLVLAIHPLPGRGHEPAPPVLTTARSVIGQTVEQARHGSPVRLRATVTYHMREWQWMFVHDGASGVFVDKVSGVPALDPGTRIIVEGVSEPGQYAPEIRYERMQVLGPGPLPAPLKPSVEQLATGSQDSQWIEASGVLRRVSEVHPFVELDLVSGGFRYQARVPGWSAADANLLIGSRVRFQGACATLFNERRQATGVLVYVPGTHYLAVDDREPDHHALPVRSVSTLLEFSHEGESQRRARISGTVLLSRPGQWAFLQDESGGVRVTGADIPALTPGLEVEAFGFPGVERHMPVLSDSTIKVIGPGRKILPRALTVDEILRQGIDSQLVRVRGRVADFVPSQNTLFLYSGPRLFAMTVESAATGRPVPNGAIIEATGVAVLQTDHDHRPQGLTLKAASWNNVTVVQRPSWWTVRHTALVGGIMLALMGAVLAWVYTLRDRVRRQTATIETQMLELCNALAEVKTLQGILPICSYCKKVRDDANSWSQVEVYVARHSEAKFSHGICPACYEVHVRPELETLHQRDRETPAEACRL